MKQQAIEYLTHERKQYKAMIIEHAAQCRVLAIDSNRFKVIASQLRSDTEVFNLICDIQKDIHCKPYDTLINRIEKLHHVKAYELDRDLSDLSIAAGEVARVLYRKQQKIQRMVYIILNTLVELKGD